MGIIEIPILSHLKLLLEIMISIMLILLSMN